jgi:uncharacterized protein (UPF0128 family)
MSKQAMKDKHVLRESGGSLVLMAFSMRRIMSLLRNRRTVGLSADFHCPALGL